MDDILLHPKTRAELTALLHDAPHAVLLVAPTGTGKFTIAQAWARQFATPTEVTLLEPDEKGTITIEATKALYQRTRAKQSGYQVVIIDHAEAMSNEAQNAFLKLLEEPRTNLTFILNTPSTDVLLPTILSRVQTVLLHPVSTQALAAHARQVNPDLSEHELSQLLFVAQGRPAVLAAMAHDPAAFEHYKHTMQCAKQLLASDRYQRLTQVQELAKDKHELISTLEAMLYMVTVHVQRDPHSHTLRTADALQECLARLRQNGNPRAQLVHLFMTS